MIYLVVTIALLIMIILSYTILIIMNTKKIENKFIIMCIHTFSVIIANLLHISTFNKLFILRNECVAISRTEVIPKRINFIGINFSREMNMLGITGIDRNDVKMYLVFIISIITILLLISANKRNKEKSKIKKVLENIACVAIILYETFMSYAIMLM